MIKYINRKMLTWRSNRLRRKIILSLINNANDNTFDNADAICYFSAYVAYFLIHGEYPPEEKN